MSFGVVLKDCLNESNVSVRNFSEVTGINRGWVYNIFNGKKPLPEDRFHRIMEAFPFTKQQQENLSNSYYEDMFGIDSFKKIQFIIKSINKLGIHNNYMYSFFPSSQCVYNSDSQYINSKTSLIDSIIFLLSPTDKAISKNAIYTNFSFEHKKIDDITLNYLKKYQNINFFHIVNFDTIGMEIHNLQNIFCSAKYASMGYNTFYYYNNRTITLQADNIFPYFFITDKGVLLYDNSLSEGLLLLNKDIIKYFLEKANNIFDDACPLVMFNNKLKPSFYMDNILFSIGYHPSIFCQTNQDSLYSFISNKHDTVTILHPKTLFELINNNSYISTLLKDSTIDDIDKILNSLIAQHFQKGNILLLRNDLFSMSDNINISGSSKSLYVFGSLEKSAGQFCDNFSICINNKLLTNDFLMFQDYIKRNHLCYNTAHTDFIFNKLRATMDKNIHL